MVAFLTLPSMPSAMIAGATAAVTASALAFSSGRNMIQTWRVCEQARTTSSMPSPLPMDQQEKLLLTDSSAAFIMATPSEFEDDTKIDASSSVREQVKALQSLERKDLLQLFLWHCELPKLLGDIDGDWNGELLENNGFVLTQVTKFLTNTLFGKRRKWNGKLFDSSRKNQGRNRFVSSFSRKASPTNNIETEHTFDYNVKPSRLGVLECPPLEEGMIENHAGETNTKMKVILLDYSKHQSRFSLWHSMKDELRVLKGTNGCIMLGLGSMSWSGGVFNASPFCLWREDSISQANNKRQ